MVIYENIEVIESAIEVFGNMQVKKDHNIVWFHASHTLCHNMAIVWKSMRQFYYIIITYSSKQKLELKHSWKTLQLSLKFKTSGNNMSGEHDKCHLRLILVAYN